MDCLLKLQDIDPGIPLFYVKVILYGLIPIILGLICSFVWYIIYLFKKVCQGVEIDVVQNLRVTFYIVVYLTYPSITNLCFSLFNCF
jgi:hypothetical protein